MNLVFLLSTLFLAAHSAPTQKPSKYFYEPTGSLAHQHYSLKYFKGVQDEPTRQHLLSDLMRAFAHVSQQENWEYWIGHGTLLGWWWNGKIMPWDLDIDVQVSLMQLEKMVALNGSVWEIHPADLYPYSTATEPKNYTLDVNPNWIVRVNDDANLIDARFIDTSTGNFIDITALAETDPQHKPGMVQCKHNHFYSIDSLYPLRQVQFEGVIVNIPNNYEPMLETEYSSRVFEKFLHNNHRWDAKCNEWIRFGDFCSAVIDEDIGKPNTNNAEERFDFQFHGARHWLERWWDSLSRA